MAESVGLRHHYLMNLEAAEGLAIIAYSLGIAMTFGFNQSINQLFSAGTVKCKG